MTPKIQDHAALDEIWHQVPDDYYQRGVRSNYLQRIWHTGKLRIVAELIRKKPTTVLDVGSASGWFLSELRKIYPDAEYTGVDVYESAIRYAKEHYKDISFQVADAHKLPYKANSFDIVICTEVLEHVVDPERVVAELKRVVKPTGKVIVEMDSGNVLFKAVWYWWTNLRKGVWRDSHIHTFDASKLETLLRESDMKLLEKKTFNATMAVAFALQK